MKTGMPLTFRQTENTRVEPKDGICGASSVSLRHYKS